MFPKKLCVWLGNASLGAVALAELGAEPRLGAQSGRAGKGETAARKGRNT